ncbi:short-chain dehydrogenase/reductase family 42E member 1 isoform X2 [Osmerus mordax]|uniref:short-chain dehydrogenase/reductase family 42E member 1 isoform X2 n=1 Tax=Osmerus mordax TaxID=8014 RepID=UPI00350FFE5F
MGTSRADTYLITGGSGYFGYRLACSLLQRGAKILLFDMSPPSQELPEGITFLKGDVRDYVQVVEAVTGIDCVFHIASYGMSGREQLNRRLIEDVNVQGTEHILRACVERGVPRLVYTSTFNVVFGGQVIEGGDETLPYLPLHLHPDHYSRTKSIAEMAVMAANGTALEDGSGVLRTCALRPAEMIHHLIGPIYNFQPLLTRTEVYKTGVTHYFSMAKAKAELGYEPREFNLDEVVQWFRSRGHGKKPISPLKRLMVDIFLVAAFVAVVLSYLPVVGSLSVVSGSQ